MTHSAPDNLAAEIAKARVITPRPFRYDPWPHVTDDHDKTALNGSRMGLMEWITERGD